MSGSGSRSLSSGLRAARPAAFGADPSGARMERIRRSPHFANGVFVNPEGAQVRPSGGAAAEMAKSWFRKDERVRRAPAGLIPVHATTLADLARPPASGLRITWMGHSSVLAEIDGHRVLFDPVWGERCSPFAFAGPRRLHPVPVPLAALGPVDVVVISHDHYDHLDMPSIKELAGTDTVFAVPLGVGAHLEHWGVSADRIRELDWQEATKVGGLTLTATPARHFCGRGLRNTQHTLWASWVVAGDEHRIYHSGDTGYFGGFRDIGAEHGPFDITMIQVGAYSEFWPDIHMTPEEGLQTHLDLQGGRPGGVMMPIHWATFNLAMHAWAEPGERMMWATHDAGVTMAAPYPGQPFEPRSTPPVNPWWRAVSQQPVGGWAAWPPVGERLDLVAES
ncbi:MULTISPECIES: MBL fold metallo-hydrolase [Streptomyces]|uniref:L-ascorbate metabolism protein UlaG (Beta-lactamase superfamily) n=1 Tax=Streptomyces stelliscabiei TaxID=146820 RepID=A0A8I0P921_9ACTN|nr:MULTISPECIES: MBL fold metallo-hydrolase [Streptomyces]KND44630.1 metallo-beta-lactamase [Streptomyces stelliscabiei]MBE1601753.1 L-ascorbate metabolism protein UlaG (beta-lactamase superfamily) [Streptomyces stelliscabiei]MDX2514939.1 MBL fold metallo-hydrolase [Streptomyces stelliscabiei]MDX2555369.1 MBL fold metallo-hydrolase [Streptomyces stelliscabiei]MDX2613058.1 MBL fold metallo-hydrolase [Streptomyces stelliscabiei]